MILFILYFILFYIFFLKIYCIFLKKLFLNSLLAAFTLCEMTSQHSLFHNGQLEFGDSAGDWSDPTYETHQPVCTFTFQTPQEEKAFLVKEQEKAFESQW